MINRDEGSIEKNQFRRPYYCYTVNNMKDTIKILLSQKYNVTLSKVDYISGP
jgi:hypothetical protein